MTEHWLSGRTRQDSFAHVFLLVRPQLFIRQLSADEVEDGVVVFLFHVVDLDQVPPVLPSADRCCPKAQPSRAPIPLEQLGCCKLQRMQQQRDDQRGQ